MDYLQQELNFSAPIVNLNEATFEGSDYEPDKDNIRLRGQLKRIWECMIKGEWKTLGEIETITGDPQASISAQLRFLRQERFGKHLVEKRPRGDRSNGLFEYRVVVNEKVKVIVQ